MDEFEKKNEDEYKPEIVNGEPETPPSEEIPENDSRAVPANESENTPKYEVYSREYQPSGNSYEEVSRVYSPEPAEKPAPKKRKTGKIIIITAAILVVALGIGALGLFIASSFASYEKRLEEMQELIDRQEKGSPESKPAESFQPSEYFDSDEDIKIHVSDSDPIAPAGKIGDPDLTIADVVALVRDSVVEITTSETYRNGLVYQSGAGSGIIVNESGILITNNHVIENASVITVRLTNGKTYDAQLVATDAISDIAVLKINAEEKLTAAVFGNSDKLVIGEEVIAIGNPTGTLGGTVTDGIISALGREVTIEGETRILLQHNAAISPGNSGGALFNGRGELIGVVNAKNISSYAEGLAFAIPINEALEVYSDLVKYGYVKGRPDSGLSFSSTLSISSFFSYSVDYIYVTESRYTDEIKVNDILVSIDGYYPKTVAEANSFLSEYNIGDKVTIVVSRTVGRDWVQHTVELEIREYAP